MPNANIKYIKNGNANKLITHAYRAVREQQISETERVTQRVSFNLHREFSVSHRVLSRPVLKTLVLQHKHTHSRWQSWQDLLLEVVWEWICIMSVCMCLYLISLLQFCQHHDRVAFPFPNHPPEIIHRVRQRTLCGDVIVLLPVTLKNINTWR